MQLHLPRRPHAPVLLSLLIVLFGIAVLLGWWLSNELLQRGWWWFAPVSVIESLGILSMGLGLFCFALRKRALGMVFFLLLPIMTAVVLLIPSLALILDTIVPGARIFPPLQVEMTKHMLAIMGMTFIAFSAGFRKNILISGFCYGILLIYVGYDFLDQVLNVFTVGGEIPTLVEVAFFLALWGIFLLPESSLRTVLKESVLRIGRSLANVPILSKLRSTFGILIVFMLLFSYLSYSYVAKIQQELLFTDVLLRSALVTTYEMKSSDMEMMTELEEKNMDILSNPSWERSYGKFTVAMGQLSDIFTKYHRTNELEKILQGRSVVEKRAKEFTQIILSAQKEKGIDEEIFHEQFVKIRTYDAVIESLTTVESLEKEYVLSFVTYAGHLVIVHAVLFIILSLSFAWGLSRLIARPLVRLKRAVERIKKGENAITTDGYAEDEVGHLAESFSRMTAWLIGAQRRIDKAYHKLRETTEQDEIILGNIGEAVIALDEKGVIHYCNPLGRTLLEFTEDVGRASYVLPPLYDDRGSLIQGQMHPVNQAIVQKKVCTSRDNEKNVRLKKYVMLG